MITMIQMPSFPFSVVLSFSILILLCLIGGMVYGWMNVREKKKIRIYAVPMIVQYVLIQNAIPLYQSRFAEGQEFMEWFGRVPILLFLLTEVILTFVTAHMIRFLSQWKKTHITLMSVKESVDLLPTGICFSADNGMPLLVNNKMESICFELCKESLSDAKKFWKTLTSGENTENHVYVEKGENPMVELEDGSVYRFSKSRVCVEERMIWEIVATDITRQYELKCEQEKKNAKLADRNARMRNYSKNIGKVTREREILDAKIGIHDNAGKTLLASKRYLTLRKEEKNREELLSLWNRNVVHLKDEASSEKTADELKQLLDASHAAGVKIIFDEGMCPEEGMPKKLVITALHECLTNTIRHAKGDELHIRINQKNDTYHVILTNNGEVPKSEIRETGGLKYLRKMVEDEQGTMKIQWTPRFVLELTLSGGMRENEKI